MTSPGTAGAFLVAAPLERAEAVSDVSAGRPACERHEATASVAPVAPDRRSPPDAGVIWGHTDSTMRIP
jgi:hypothetical protein